MELKSIEQQNDLRFYRDGVAATVSVNAWQESETEQLNLRVNGKPDASTSSDMSTQLLLGHLPMLLSGKSVETALVVGLGSGITSGAVTRYPSLKRVHTVEISSDVAAAARLFSRYNNDVLDDPRMQVIVGDARSVLEMSEESYDMIVSEPSNPWISGIAGVFTQEFYALCRTRLTSAGLMAQWVHLYDNSQEALDLVLRTFSTVFPYVSIWQSEELDLILIGSAHPSPPDVQMILSRFEIPAVRDDLHRIHLDRPSVLLSLELASPENGRFFVSSSGPLHTDSHPALEFLAQRAFFEHKEATQWLGLNQNLSPHPKTLLAESLQAYGLTTDDYNAFAEFHRAYRLPAPEIMRSICVRWQNDPAAQHSLLQWLPRLPALGTAEELEALRLASMREALLRNAESNSQLLEYYAKLLLAVYRSQRSVFNLPQGAECRAILERLLSTPAGKNPIHKLELAEFAWDHRDSGKCIELSGEAFRDLNWAEFRDNHEFYACVARYCEALLYSGKPAEAKAIADRFQSAGMNDLRVNWVARKSEATSTLR